MKILILLFTALSIISCKNTTSSAQQNSESVSYDNVGGGCDGCELMYDDMPEEIYWVTMIASQDEPGERMTISGKIFQPDGKTPAEGIILYVYHTDATGNYSQTADQPNSMHHGHLRGWMKTKANGEYKFSSIKPASYPSSTAPAHIHPLIKEPDKNEYWIDEYVFDDDPFLTEEHLKNNKNRGGSGMIHLTKNENGVWIGKRDIILGKNVPNYPD